jgi:protein-tyrosine phosphatase
MYFFEITGLAAGRLAVVTRPRGGEMLQQEMTDLRAAGYDVLVSALTPPEEKEHDLALEGSAAAAAGVRYRALAIPDYGLPEAGTLEGPLRELAAELKAGAAIAVHCGQGIGRSPLIVASLMRHTGFSMEDAFARIRTARGRRVPDTEEQKQWVKNLAL